MYNALGYTFEKNPKTIPDPLDREAPVCASIDGDNTIGGSPNTFFEIDVPLGATDRQNPISYMRFSDDGTQWSDWMPYQSPFRIVAEIQSNWASVGIMMQYRDSAGNISQPCTWTETTEGW